MSEKKLISIIIPTLTNPGVFDKCLESVYRTGIVRLKSEVIVINQGQQPIKERYGHWENIKVINVGHNIRWEGALKLGLENSDSHFVVFLNDDTIIPVANVTFFTKLLTLFSDPEVGAVGPTTTCAAGMQSIFSHKTADLMMDVKWLIFFAVMVRREALIKAGGIDTTLPGGDDFDLCIRLRDAGYKLVIEPSNFIYHQGFVTGNRINGDHTVDGGWNSPRYTENVNTALIKKHGFRKFFTTMWGQSNGTYANTSFSDESDDIIQSFAIGDKILEIGCGQKKLFENSIGLDKTANGEQCYDTQDRISCADVQCDANGELPFEDGHFDTIIASHVLEHCIDTANTLRNWIAKIRSGGHLIIAVPNENVTSGIPLNPEHCHAFTKQSMTNILELLGMKVINGDMEQTHNLIICSKKEAIC